MVKRAGGSLLLSIQIDHEAHQALSTQLCVALRDIILTGGFAAGERYWPDDTEAQRFYAPVDRGLEIRISEKLQELRRLNEAAAKAR